MFLDGGSMLTGGSSIAGDYYFVNSGSVTGGDDTFTVGAPTIIGDFHQTFSGVTSAVGGDDTITPARLADSASIIELVGDVLVTSTVTTGGDDLIDLRTTDISGLTQTAILYGDTTWVNPGASLTGGNDTIHGSANGDLMFGESATNFGVATGGDDSLSGYGGADTISGNTGSDFLAGGDGNDILSGGAGADAIAAARKSTLRLMRLPPHQSLSTF